MKDKAMRQNKLASSKLRSQSETTTYRLTYSLTGVRCRATSVAKNRFKWEEILEVCRWVRNLDVWNLKRGCSLVFWCSPIIWCSLIVTNVLMFANVQVVTDSSSDSPLLRSSGSSRPRTVYLEKVQWSQ